MHKLLTLAVALLAPSLASAQSFFTVPAIVTPQDGTYYENGIGSPSVAHLGEDDYIMFFETRLSTDYLTANSIDASGCRNGAVWGVGVAHSTDGRAWTVSDEPLVVPQTGTFYSCVAAHPSSLVEGGNVYLYFKAEQLDVPCPGGVGEPVWGCDRQVGVGVTQYTFNATSPSFGSVSSPAIALNTSGFGYPSVVKVGTTYRMFISKIPSLYKATGTTPTDFSLSGTASISPGSVTWTPDRVFNPAAFCNNESGYPYTIYLGGKDLDASGAINDGGWGRTISPDTVEWFTATNPSVSWSGSSEWRHWDALRVGISGGSCDGGPASEQVLVYYSDKDANNRNQVGVAYTSNTVLSSGAAPWDGNGFSTAAPMSKVCSAAPADADGYFQEFGAANDTAGAWDESWNLDDEQAGAASCSTVPAGLAGLFGLMLPIALIRRRRS